jgi:hypothetical protein
MSEKQQVLFEIYLENGEFKVKAKEAEQGLSGITNETKKGEKNFKDYLKAGLAIGAVTVIIRKIFSTLKDSVKAASDLKETTNKFNVVFSKVGKQANENAKRLSDMFGHSHKQSLQFLTDTGDLLTGLGMTQEKALDLSTAVAELGTDLASFSNYAGGATGAVDALTKGLLGEREMMKGLGIVINEEMLQNELRAQGKDKLTGLALNQAKAEATLALAIQQSKNAIGDKARSFDSYANIQARINSRLDDMSAKLGQDLMPAIGSLGIAFLHLTKTEGPLLSFFNTVIGALADSIEGIALLSLYIGRFSAKYSGNLKENQKNFETWNASFRKAEKGIIATYGSVEKAREKALSGDATAQRVIESFDKLRAGAQRFAQETAKGYETLRKYDDAIINLKERIGNRKSGNNTDGLIDDFKAGIPSGSGSDNNTPPGKPKEADVSRYYQSIGNLEKAHLAEIYQNEQAAVANAQLMLQQKIISEQEYQSALIAIREESRQQEVIAEATAWQEKAAASERYYRARLGMESAVWQGTASIAQAGASLMNEKNKALFMVGKVSALTNIAMNTAEGITAGYKWGPFIGSANAAMLTVLGAVQAKNILKQKPPEPAKLKKPEIEVPTLPSYAVGAWDIPRDHVAQIHKGETILPKPFAQEFREKTEGKTDTSPSIVINVQGSIIDTQGLLDIVDDAQEQKARTMGATKYTFQSAY